MGSFFIFAAHSSRALAAIDPRPVPNFGLMWNNDGDLSFTGQTPSESVRNLKEMVDRLAGTPVKTLCQSVGAGTDIVYYPTKVASTWGWRPLPNDPEPERTARIKAGIDANIDAPRISGTEAIKLGIRFVPSIRMNDWHYAANALHDPLTSRFWMQHHDQLDIGEGHSPLNNPSAAHECANLLDFGHQETRDYRLAEIDEVINRYQDIMTGVELDFMRAPIFFRRGEAEQNAPLMTDLVRKVRARLDEIGARRHRTYYLFVRVPPTLDNCHWAGLEVEKWMSQRLVDVVIPSQLMTLSHDMPVDKFVAAAGTSGCKIYPAILPRTGYGWAFSDHPTKASYAAGPDRRPLPELIHGAASNYWFMGAAGIQIFNFGWPDDDWTTLVIHNLTQPAALSREDLVYAITPAYYLDSENNYQYRKQVPSLLPTDTAKRFTIIVGNRFDQPEKAATPDYVGLRIGLRGVNAEDVMQVTLNGRVLHNGPLSKVYLPTSAKNDPAAPSAYVQFPLSDYGLIRQGPNEVRLRFQPSVRGADCVVNDVQIGVLYKHKLFSW
ncbi:MAG TPA: hypothetical protein VG722_03920 [Tepidisphaeraceae bacterium]|nr:hypothetical protein [Tepidisphaeraceae bacterium]